MFKKSTWLHLRIPFSYFLLPIFLWAITLSPNLSELGILILFIVLHFFIYPASNAYNSYYDKDKGSIGGLESPPQVDKYVLYIAWIFDVLGIALSLWLIESKISTMMILVYIIVSRAYSHPNIRLKKRPMISWFVAGFFQGAWVVWLVYLGLNSYEFSSVFKPKILFGGLLASAILWGSYPMTQIYQHKEDQERGDITLSILLGLKYTFLFTGLFFALSTVGFYLYFSLFFDLKYGWLFILFMAPVVIYFVWWFLSFLSNKQAINYKNTMRLNFISATCLGAFYLFLFFDTTQVWNVIGLY